MQITLDKLSVGKSGIICTVGGEGALRRHLLDMGLTPGIQVTVTGTAPLGDPLSLQLRGYALTLRKQDAAAITLEV